MTLQELKDLDLAPQHLTDEGYNTISNGYILPGETPRDMYMRCAQFSASVLNKPEAFVKDFFHAMWHNWLCVATPTLSNGYTKNLQISCYSSISEDSVNGIMKHLSELATLTKNGGGVGSSYDLLRPSGSRVSAGGVSSGILPFLKMLDATISGITQGSSRRGAVASYLNIEHGDAEEFINIRSQVGDLSRKIQSVSFHNAISIGDNVMNAVVDGDTKYRNLWNQLMNQRVETGEPYILFLDNANKNCPDEYVGKVTQSNLCLHGFTKVRTKEFGSIFIKDLVGKTVTIFDGQNWVLNSSFRKTQSNASFIELTIANKTILCTSKHNWPVVGRGVTSTDKLIVGDMIECLLLDGGTACQITEIKTSQILDDAYCTTVPSTNIFLLDGGILTGNCSEIMAPVTTDESFVCCLSSLNLAKYYEWKDYKFANTGLSLVELSTYFLDAVITNFTKQTLNMEGMQNARRFADRHRMLGVGVLGWHTLLQQEMIPFESFRAMQLNNEVFSKIKTETEQASRALAIEYGPSVVNMFRRNTALVAIAPTMSNSIISGGVSQGIEPITANIFSQKSSKGTFIKKNPTLVKLLQSKNLDTNETWEIINRDRGSVKNVLGLSDDEKRVFLTAREINQFALVQQAAQRQKYVSQGQSLNLFFSTPSNKEEGRVVAKYMNDVHLEAWKSGVKSLYYLKTESPLKGDVIVVDKDGSCKSCEG